MTEQAISDAVSALYTTFGCYPLHPDTNACPCCHKPEQERVLHSRPLRELRAEDLRDYAGEAMLVWGGEEDFKHFLPRIFELMAGYDRFTTDIDDPAIIFAKLRYADWLGWPSEETTTVRRYLLAAWEVAIESNPASTDVEEWLCGIAQAEDDLAPYLTRWQDSRSVNAGRHLAVLLTEHAFIQANAHPRDFWAERKEQFAQMQAWLRSDAIKQSIKSLSDVTKDDTVELAMQVLGVK